MAGVALGRLLLLLLGASLFERIIVERGEAKLRASRRQGGFERRSLLNPSSRITILRNREASCWQCGPVVATRSLPLSLALDAIFLIPLSIWSPGTTACSCASPTVVSGRARSSPSGPSSSSRSRSGGGRPRSSASRCHRSRRPGVRCSAYVLCCSRSRLVAHARLPSSLSPFSQELLIRREIVVELPGRRKLEAGLQEALDQLLSSAPGVDELLTVRPGAAYTKDGMSLRLGVA